jgi:hypothetical protein
MPTRKWTLLLSLLVDCDIRTAAKIVTDGPDTIRTIAVRDRAHAVIKRRKEIEKAFATMSR